jgi:outer membrane protein OmpA-like peptidoglycan-associated protein
VALSNGVFLTVFDIPPLQGNGWEVRVLSYRDIAARAQTGAVLPIAVISTFEEVSISPAINDVGAGSITLDLDSELWDTTLADGTPASSLREYEHVWQVYEDGALRFEFLGQVVEEGFETNDETRAITISGPGGADVLRWGKVMTPQYPYPAKPAPSTELGTYQFQNTAVMDAWLQLLAACKKRGTLPFVTPTFTAVVDSYGAPWADNPLPAPVPGTTTNVYEGDVFFAPDQYSLSNAAKTTLNNFIAGLGTDKTPNLVVVGHTDSTNTMTYNQTLSENRANSVAAYIRGKVPLAVINASGRGETQPVATNATSKGRAKNRRVVVTYTPTTLTPSLIIYEPTLGSDLLSVLKENVGDDPNVVSTIRAEFHMRPNFILDVVQAGFGVHRDGDVIFYEGSTNTISKSRSRTRADIANLVAIQNDYGYYSIATSAPSIARWLQREQFTRDNGTFDDTMRGQIAMKTLEQSEDEVSTWTIAVAPYGTGRRIFVDYDLGDWVGVSQYHGTEGNTIDPFRVHAISIKVDKDGTVDLELTLQSKVDVRFKTLKEQVTSLIDHAQRGIKLFISDNEPTAARVGDLWTPAPSPTT